MIHFILIYLLMDCRIKFGNNKGAVFQAAFNACRTCVGRCPVWSTASALRSAVLVFLITEVAHSNKSAAIYKLFCSGCLKRIIRAAIPLAQPNGTWFWRKQGRSGAQRHASAAKSMCSEGSLAQPNLQPGSPFFCLLCFGEAKKSKWPRGHEAQSKMIKKRIQKRSLFLKWFTSFWFIC